MPSAYVDTIDHSNDFFIRLERVCSQIRLYSYRSTDGTNKETLCRYLWNIALCESLYPSFQILEVSFRNAVHLEIQKVTNVSEWLISEPAFLYQDERRAIRDSKQSLQDRKGTVTEPFLVAEMGFGFWTSLLDSRYDRIWHRIIAHVFPNMPRTIRTRGNASKPMNKVRKIRNAASHHHSIWHWHDLPDQHKEMHSLINWICSSASIMAKSIDRFPGIHSGGPKQFDALVSSFWI